MANVTLKGGVVKEYENGTTAMEIAKSIGMGLYKAVCICKINGEYQDLRTPIEGDCELEFLTFEDDEEAKKTFRHTASHIMAQAVKRLYPEAKLAIGPSIANGFYYDFDMWQYSDSGVVSGISGKVDLNISFKNYAEN